MELEDDLTAATSTRWISGLNDRYKSPGTHRSTLGPRGFPLLIRTVDTSRALAENMLITGRMFICSNPQVSRRENTTVLARSEGSLIGAPGHRASWGPGADYFNDVRPSKW